MSVELPDSVHAVELAVPDAYGVLRGKRVPAGPLPGGLLMELAAVVLEYSR